MDAATITNPTTGAAAAAQAAEAAIATADAAGLSLAERMAAVHAMTPNVADLDREHTRLDALRFSKADHGLSEAELDEQYTAANDAWMKASHEQIEAAAEIAEEPAASAAEALERLELYAQVAAGGALDRVLKAEMSLEEDLRTVALGAVATLRRLAAAEPVARLPYAAHPSQVVLSRFQADWAVAKKRYDGARAEYDANSARWDECFEALVDAAPPWNRVARPAGDGKMTLRWSNTLQYEVELRCLMPHERAESEKLRGPLEKWLDDNAAALAQLDQIGEANDELYDRLCDAERGLIETPAPDLPAVLSKQALYGREIDDQKRGYQADPAAYAARRDASSVVDSWPVWIFEDLLRLSGASDPILTTDHPQPRQWLRRFRDTGADISVVKGTRLIDIKFPTKASEGFNDMLAELGANRALLDAVVAYVVDFS